MTQIISEDLVVEGNLTVLGESALNGAVETLQDLSAVNIAASGHAEIAQGINDFQWATYELTIATSFSLANDTSGNYAWSVPEAAASDLLIASVAGLPGSPAKWFVTPHPGAGLVTLSILNRTGSTYNLQGKVAHILLIKWPGVISWLS